MAHGPWGKGDLDGDERDDDGHARRASDAAGFREVGRRGSARARAGRASRRGEPGRADCDSQLRPGTDVARGAPPRGRALRLSLRRSFRALAYLRRGRRTRRSTRGPLLRAFSRARRVEGARPRRSRASRRPRDALGRVRAPFAARGDGPRWSCGDVDGVDGRGHAQPVPRCDRVRRADHVVVEDGR